MKPSRRLPAAFSILLIVVLLVACAGQQATPTVTPVPPKATPVPPTVAAPTEAAPETSAAVEPYGNREDAPPYAVRGPYRVGVRDFAIEPSNESERPLTVTVWYPAIHPEGAEDPITYEMGFAAGDTPNFPSYGYAIEDASPDLSGGPYPLVVYTHAHWTFRQDIPYLVEHLASRGFVVIAADHEDNWGTIFHAKPWQTEFQRPDEVGRGIDFAEGLNATGQPLAGMIDLDNIGVAGWSYGGETVLVAAGARLDLANYRAWCDTHTVDGKPPEPDCVDILDHEQELAALAGLDSVPEGLWPDWSDERIDAAVALAPVARVIGPEGLTAVKTPTLLIVGSGDSDIGPGYREYKPYDRIAAEPRAEVVFDNAEHIVFFSDCDAIPGVVDLGFFGFCADPVWNMDRAHDLVNHFATAFLQTELKDDAEAAKALAPENVNFLGVEYKTTGYGAPIPPAEPPAPQGLRPDAPEYAKRGPFPVGYKSLVIGEDTDRPLEAGLWYPALNPKGAQEEITYPIKPKMPLDPIDAPVVAYGHALQDAEVDPSAGPYPLVIFSHGFGANAVWYNTLLEHYASHGFIVLAPEHIEQFDPEYSDIWKASIDRPLDIKRTLDYAEQINAPDGDMAGLIDMQHVAVAGHSYGGYTSLAMAGAQYDLAAFNARCAQLPPDDPHTFLCAPLVPKEADMAARAGLDPMPEGLWPSLGDPRVTAILPMAGDSYLFDKAGLAKITIPMMAIGGTADTGTPYEWGSKPAYDNASSAKKALVTLEGAEHTITTSCKNMPWVSETPFGPWICFDPVWDKDRGLDLIHHFSTAFLLDTLKGDEAAAKALAPENVTFPGIKYESAGYGAAP